MTQFRRIRTPALLFGLMTALSARAASKGAIDFDRDIRPILSENCFACHGPDEKQRKADLRLDVHTEALAAGQLVVPGHAERSELLERVTSTDPSRRMPPRKTGKCLTPRQVESLR